MIACKLTSGKNAFQPRHSLFYNHLDESGKVRSNFRNLNEFQQLAVEHTEIQMKQIFWLVKGYERFDKQEIIDMWVDFQNQIVNYSLVKNDVKSRHSRSILEFLERLCTDVIVGRSSTKLAALGRYKTSWTWPVASRVAAPGALRSTVP